MTPEIPRRLLVIAPSWLGDVVMATPAFRMIRRALPGAFIGALVRPGIDELLAGSDLFDELHVDRARGVMGPKLVASKLRPRRYDAAALFTNSFSTALVARLAFIPRRIGYDRDGRGLLLTDRLRPERTPDGRWACIPAVDYYLRIAERIGGLAAVPGNCGTPGLELATTAEQDAEAIRILRAAGAGDGGSFAVLNPGANNPAKRWPPERFGEVAAHLACRGYRVLISGAPSERDVVATVHAAAPGVGAVALTDHGLTIGALKGILRRAALLVTNDTGPRHIAAAFRIPTVTLFGPTDPRWTTLPDDGTPRVDLVADPTLPPDQLADDHPDRCRIERISARQVIDAVETVLTG